MDDRGATLPPTGVFDRTGPDASSWDPYKAQVVEAWGQLLRRDDVNEPVMHRFLEQHPCLVPFSYGPGLGRVIQGHHGSINEVVYSKPRLPGDEWFEPDFMRVTSDSGGIHLYLIEIEDPRKPLFTRKGEFSAKYKPARGQLTDWDNWWREGRNRDNFREWFGFDNRRFNDSDVELHRILVFGRRSEIDGNPRGRQARRDDKAVESMTYDRLSPKEDARQDVSVQVVDHHRKVLYVPPTFRLGPTMMSVLVRFEGWEEAIRRSDDIDETRREFLIRRIPYWTELANTHTGPIVHSHSSWE